MSRLYEFSSTHRAKGAKSITGNINLWHNKLVHVNSTTLKFLHEHAKDFPNLPGELKCCHPCSLGNATKKSFDSHVKPATYPGEVVHSDLAGTFPVSMDDAIYSCTFLDQFSRYTHVTGLHQKSDAVEAMDMYKDLSHLKKYFPKGVAR